MNYTINTGRFENGTDAQRAAFIQLFGAENVQYKFDLYFHWYNIVHEYGHCLCNHYESSATGLEQELLVNNFAVSFWKYAGYERELKLLEKMLREALRRIKNPVPGNMSFTEYYEQIWETAQITDVAIYGYLQFKSVLLALEDESELGPALEKIGIRAQINNASLPHREYPISAETAREVLNDVRRLLDDLGIEQPEVDIKLVDDPSIQCVMN